MKLHDHVCTIEQGINLKQLGIKPTSTLLAYIKNHAVGCEMLTLDSRRTDIGDIAFYPAATVSELLKMLPWIIRYEGNEYFMSFAHGNKGYRVIYETQKQGLIFNADGDLDREKKALFNTFRSGKNAAEVLAEYLRMLLDSNSHVLNANEINQRLQSA